MIEKKKIIKKKCQHCNKRLKLIEENLCKCNHIFCSKHRLCHTHNCEYNKKEENKEKIKKDNPKVENSKVEKI